jgi:SAM-dependent methyltransferase
MGDAEFAVVADELYAHLPTLSRRDAIALACRGSGDPAALAWLAEGLELGDGLLVADLGGGTGGPAAWLHDRYGCPVVVVDPVEEAARVARDVFGIPAVVADGGRLPLAARVDVVLALGVLSVTDDPRRLLAEARRLAPRLGVLEWCAEGGPPVEVAGSRFPTVDGLRTLLATTGWAVVAGPEVAGLPAPPSWDRADSPAPTEEEDAVGAVIDRGAIQPQLLVCRATPPA